jgi:hypothetical protein
MYARFKSFLTPNSFFTIKVKGVNRSISFINWFYTAFDKDTIEALLSDERFDKYYSVEKETLDLSDDTLKAIPVKPLVTETVTEATDTDLPKADRIFRTVNEAREWLKEEFNAPSAINTVAKCVEFAKSKGFVIDFKRD